MSFTLNSDGVYLTGAATGDAGVALEYNMAFLGAENTARIAAIAGKAAISHTHSASDIVSGTVAVARLPVMVASGASHAAGIVPDTPSSAGTTKYLREDGTWSVPPDTNSGGTVTSVGLAAPGIFSVTGTPITTSGGFTLSLVNQNANLIWAGPTTGSAATPTFRALVAADIPNIAESQVTNLTTDLAGKAASVHTHAASDITSGTFAAARLGVTEAKHVVFDGGGSVVTTANSPVEFTIPFAGTITGWTLAAEQSGSITVEIDKSTYAGYPTMTSIVASAKPALSSAQKNSDTTLTGWTTSITAGDVLRVYLSGTPASIQKATLTLNLLRT